MDIKHIIDRYNQFYSGKRNIMIKTQFPAVNNLKLINYATFDLNTWNGIKDYYNIFIENNIKMSEDHTDIDDDYIPECFSHLGTGAGGAIFDNIDVLFTDASSWAPQSIFNYEELSRLDSTKNTKWAKTFLDINSFLMDKCNQKLCVTPLMHYTPLDAANSLRGNDLFYDFYEYPEQLTKLLGYCTDTIIRFHDDLMKITGDVLGGQVMWNIFIPGKKTIGFMEDTCNLCSPQNYKEFGMSFTEKIVKNFNGAFIHNHMLGIHQFENISNIEKLSILNIANDPNCKTVIECIDKIKPILKTPLYFEISYDDLVANIDKLIDIKSVVWVHCKNKEQAKQAVKFIR